MEEMMESGFEQPPVIDAIVIGGGFAGITAARDLGRRGRSVVVLEARDRLGGRTWRRPFADTDLNIEFGGQWLARPWQPNVAREVEHYGLAMAETPMPLSPMSLAAGRRRQGIVPVPVDEVIPLERVWFHLIQAARRLDAAAPLASPPADLDIPFVEWLAQFRLPAFTLEYLYAWGAGVFGCPIERIPTLGMLAWIADYDYSVISVFLGESEILRDGTSSAIEAMVRESGAEIRLHAPVRHVAQHGHGVTVTTDAGERFSARAAVVAVPLNTLGDISFDPALNPARQEAAQEGHIGHSVKVWALVEGAPPGFYGVGQGPGLLWLATQQELPEGSLMLGFGPGPGLLEVNSVEAIQRNVDAYMDGARVLKVDAHDWSADPYSKSAWVGYGPGQLTRWGNGIRRPEGRLFFAGSDIATKWAGWIEGAVDTGGRAAAQIDALLQSALQ
jgi:monoamine oxidase